MRLATVEQSREIDDLSQRVYGLSGEVLMESAGALAAREIHMSFFPELSRGTLGVVAGPGNNGGDALVVARHMHSQGYRDLIVFMLAPKDNQSPLFKLQLQRAEKQGVKIVNLSEHPEKREQIKSCELLVDGVFGVGLSRKIEGEFLHLVDIVNSVKVPIVSLDTPSGLNANTGIVEGGVVKAHTTLSFGLAKPGFFVSDGPEYVGKLRILPIGFPYEALRGVATTHFLYNEKLARRYLKTRKNTSNKSDYGHLLVAAGRPGMWGAGVLVSSSAYRLGAGYVTWSSFEAPPSDAEHVPEALTSELLNDDLWKKNKFTAAAVGPGLGVGQPTADLIAKLKGDENLKSAVIDADGITTCVQFGLFPLPKNWVITPHSGELSRIIGLSAKEIEKDRYSAALKAAKICGCHVLLKG
ncbi:MAG: NAD(P)H-hydrate epimerase, partial [Bdellovibrionales bacterium]|nr:NAD(P)H-hydrate epimerase [Bdellovibrionales bacterium]